MAYTGKIKGEYAMLDMDDIGTEVEHRFAVSVDIFGLFFSFIMILFFFFFFFCQ